MCAGFQQAVVDVLVKKTIRAAGKYGVKTVMLAGGVAANKSLRTQLAQAASDAAQAVQDKKLKFLVPDSNLCTDNAAMVAVAGYYESKKKKVARDNWRRLKVDPNWELE